MQLSIHIEMPRKAKIAVSLSREVLTLLDRHAHGRSRSRCVEEELLSALRAREWERLSAQMSEDETAELSEWARSSYQVVDQQLQAVEGRSKGKRAARSNRRRRAG